jgi:hypothetical protein
MGMKLKRNAARGLRLVFVSRVKQVLHVVVDSNRVGAVTAANARMAAAGYEAV